MAEVLLGFWFWQPQNQVNDVVQNGENTKGKISIYSLEAQIDLKQFLLDGRGVIGAWAYRATVAC